MAAAFMQMFDKYYNGLFFSCVCCKALFIWAQKKAACFAALVSPQGLEPWTH